MISKFVLHLKAILSYLRVLGSPNPGQSFGRGLSGPQATEVKMTRSEVGWRRISPYIRLIHFWVPHFGRERPNPIRELQSLMFFCFFTFSNLRKVRGIRSSLGGPNYARCRCVNKFLMFDFLSVLKTRRRYVKLSLTPDRPPLAACTGNYFDLFVSSSSSSSSLLEG